jgi:hypothetical protein
VTCRLHPRYTGALYFGTVVPRSRFSMIEGDRCRAHRAPRKSACCQRKTGHRQDEEPMATLDEIKARLMQRTPAAGGADMLPTSTGLSQDGESMQTLTDEIRTFIVKSLACFDSPSQVAEAVKTHFDVEISRQHVFAYDPKASQRMAPRWRELHAATRQAYLREVAEIGIADKTVRLAMLDRMAHHALANNRLTNTAAFLEQAAKECGGVYESRRSITPQLPVSQPAAPQPPAPEPAVPQISQRVA